MPDYSYNKDYPFAAFITNLGKYNEGELVGEWVKFPTTAEELKEVFKRIGIGQKDDFGNPYEEWFITDYDCYVDGLYSKLGEYENLDELNYLASKLEPTSGFDISGPTASCNSVAKLDHMIASNGTLFNMKMHPTAMAGEKGLESFISLIRGYFDQQGMHMQFNVVDRATLLDAQAHPEKYSGLIVRVAGYSALFTTLSKSLQDDIIRRTEQANNR